MALNDAQWLERVTTAYDTYKKDVGPALPIENFITWLYYQYGMEQPQGKLAS